MPATLLALAKSIYYILKERCMGQCKVRSEHVGEILQMMYGRLIQCWLKIGHQVFSNSRKIIIHKSGFYIVLQDDVILTISNRANSVLFTFLPLNFLYKVPKISAVLSFCKLILPVQSFCRSQLAGNLVSSFLKLSPQILALRSFSLLP